MCTGITFRASNGDVIFGRTMDYDYPLNGFSAVQPRGYSFKSHVDYKGKTLYAFAGAGSDMEGFVFGDGVNEHGLAISIFRKQKSLCGRSAITEILKNLLKMRNMLTL